MKVFTSTQSNGHSWLV